MKTRTPFLILAVALLAPGARLAAQTGSPAEDLTGAQRMMQLDMMEKQVRENAEREAARAKRSKLSAATYDLNHDGKLDEKEFAAWEKALRAAVAKMPWAMKKYDKNRDKKLDDAEWAVAFKELTGN
jgi:Ca2+-binding EF-hand superfamily protein